MRSRFGWAWLAWILTLCAANGCDGPALAGPQVTYESSPPVTRWADYAGTTGYGSAGMAASLAGATPEPVAGRSAAPAPAVAGTSANAGVSGSAGAPAAVSGETGRVDPSSSSASVTTASNLSFDVTTSPVGYRYQPKNIGAIWVQDASGKLVKSLEVWAGIRRRYLTRYSSALSGSGVDVTASATLPSHRTHHVTWNMKDKSGNATPPGQYSLVMELTDGDQTGRTNTVAFDTSAGPSSSSPADAPSFSGMHLQVQ